MNVQLTKQDLDAIEAIFPAGSTAGPRYHEQAMKAVNL
jgi:hypothetical protein